MTTATTDRGTSTVVTTIVIANSPNSVGPVLVTGGYGFISYHLVSRILKSSPGYAIHVLDINTTPNRLPNVKYHDCDISSAAAVRAVVQEAKPRTVFHATSPNSMILNDVRFKAVIVGGTRNLLVASKEVGSVRALVYTSTSSVIHDYLTDLVDADETLPILRPP